MAGIRFHSLPDGDPAGDDKVIRALLARDPRVSQVAIQRFLAKEVRVRTSSDAYRLSMPTTLAR